MKIYARAALAPERRAADEAALLLEGGWAEATVGQRWSLDAAIDARRQWIDEEAAELAERLSGGREGGAAAATVAYLNVLPLRYYLVKLLRVVAFFDEVRRPSRGERLELHVELGRDEDYADLLAAVARRYGARLFVVRHERDRSAVGREARQPGNAWWRRWAGAAVCRAGASEVANAADEARVVLCGNARLLDGVCGELVRRDLPVAWLYERFAVGTWRRWRGRGVGQMVCNSSLGRSHRFADGYTGGARGCRGVDLTGPVSRWLDAVAARWGGVQARMLEQIHAHFERWRPTHLVLDEDATPLARAAVAVGREMGVRSLVVQHGACGVRFGFAPLAADGICCWGPASRAQLLAWGVPAERIHVTGKPAESGPTALWRRRRRPGRGAWPRVLMFATVPPRDERPDATIFHLTGETYAAMLRMTLGTLREYGKVRLIVKLHPRGAVDGTLKRVLREFGEVDVRLARRGSVDEWLAGVDCVLSCASSAGIEAAARGVPVIQLLPAGSGDVLGAAELGLLGTARSGEELAGLLGEALGTGGVVRRSLEISGGVDGNSGPAAARRIVDVLLGLGAGGTLEQMQDEEEEGRPGNEGAGCGGGVGRRTKTSAAGST